MPMIANGNRTRKLMLDNPGGSVPDGDGGYIEGWEPLQAPDSSTERTGTR